MDEVYRGAVVLRDIGDNGASTLGLPNAEPQGSVAEDNINNVVAVHF